MARQVIVFTAYNRPSYLRETLASWSKVRGLGEAELDFHVDASERFDAVVREIYLGVHKGTVTIHPNRTHLGNQVNTYAALACGFGAYGHVHAGKPDDFVILAEDDFIVSDDILEYFTWARREYWHDSQVLAVSATQFHRQGELGEVLRLRGWTGWVWGTWRDRWEMISKDWKFNYEHRGWDWRLNDYWCGEMGYVTVAPAQSRSQHIGQYQGIHTNAATFADHQSRCFVPQVPPQEYRPRMPDVPVRVPVHHTGT